MSNTIYHMLITLEKHNIFLHKGIRKVDYGDTNELYQKVEFSKSHSFLVDPGASNHMVSYKESFS